MWLVHGICVLVHAQIKLISWFLRSDIIAVVATNIDQVVVLDFRIVITMSRESYFGMKCLLDL